MENIGSGNRVKTNKKQQQPPDVMTGGKNPPIKSQCYIQ